MDSIRIGVGSKNEAKIRSVRLAAERLWPGRDIIVIGVEVESGVRAQPMSAEETRQGARNRSRAVWNLMRDIDYSVGLEGGLEEDAENQLWFECGWCVIINKSGRIGIGSTARSLISRKLVKRLQAGEELSEVVDDLSNQANVRNSSGYMGIITNGGLPRDQCCSHAVLFAFAPFVANPIFFDES